MRIYVNVYVILTVNRLYILYYQKKVDQGTMFSEIDKI